MEDPNILNIPAFKRKRSIAAQEKRAEKRSSNAPKLTTKRRSSTRKASRRRTRVEEIDSSLTDIPIRDQYPSETLFPSPMEEADDLYLRRAQHEEKDLREMTLCGRCDGYFDNIEVAVVKLSSALRDGDRILFESPEGLFEQSVSSMQIDRKPVSLARAGSDIGLKVLRKPQVGGAVYKVIS